MLEQVANCMRCGKKIERYRDGMLREDTICQIDWLWKSDGYDVLVCYPCSDIWQKIYMKNATNEQIQHALRRFIRARKGHKPPIKQVFKFR